MAGEPSLEGAVSVLIVNSDLVGKRVWRRGYVPEKPTFPYVTFQGPVSSDIALEGDSHTMARARLVQVDLWYKEAHETSAPVQALESLLDGAQLTANLKAYGCRVSDSRRLEDPEPGVIHWAYTLRVTHGVTLVP